MVGGDRVDRRLRLSAARIELRGHRQTPADFCSGAKGGTCLCSRSAAAAAPLDDQQKRGRVDHIHLPHARARIDDVDRLGPAGAVIVDSFLGYCRRRWWVAIGSIDGCGCRRLGSSYGDDRPPQSGPIGMLV
jgi:hypothetical protein